MEDLLTSPTYRRALSLFRLGTDLLEKVPHRDDSVLDILVKLLAIADSVASTYGGKFSKQESLLSRHDTLRSRVNGPFVRLFFGTHMAKAFKIRRHCVADNLDFIEAIDIAGERLFFQEWRSGRPDLSDEFFHTARFDFSAAVDALWTQHRTGLFLSLKPPRSGVDQDVTFSSVPPPRSDIRSAVGCARIDQGAAEHRARNGEPWAMIAYGPPGTGKSSYAAALAEVTGGRLLKIDAASLPSLGVQEIGFLLDVLRPSLLLIDDFDRAPVEDTRARVLFLFEHLHAQHAGVTTIVTVNSVESLDSALLRSERIDEAKEFPLPDAEERRDVLTRLMGHEPNETVVIETEGFNHADLAGLTRRFRREPQEQALAAMKRLRALAEKAGKKGGEGGSKAAGDDPPRLVRGAPSPCEST